MDTAFTGCESREGGGKKDGQGSNWSGKISIRGGQKPADSSSGELRLERPIVSSFVRLAWNSRHWQLFARTLCFVRHKMTGRASDAV